MQNLIVALLVPVCSGYVLWSLLPLRARRALARQLVRWPLLGRLPRLQATARLRDGDGGCHCSASSAGGGAGGCGRPAAAVQPIRLVPRGQAKRF